MKNDLGEALNLLMEYETPIESFQDKYEEAIEALKDANELASKLLAERDRYKEALEEIGKDNYRTDIFVARGIAQQALKEE